VISEQLIEKLKASIDRATATQVAATRPVEKHFLAEVLYTLTVTYILGCYLTGFMKGIGIEKLGEEHGKAFKRHSQAIRRLWKKYREESRSPKLDEMSEHVSEMLRLVRAHRKSRAAKADAEREIQQFLREHGATEDQALDIAQSITIIVLRK